MTPEKRAESRRLCDAMAGDENYDRHEIYLSQPAIDFFSHAATALPEALDALDAAEKREAELKARLLRVEGYLEAEKAAHGHGDSVPTEEFMELLKTRASEETSHDS